MFVCLAQRNFAAGIRPAGGNASGRELMVSLQYSDFLDGYGFSSRYCGNRPGERILVWIRALRRERHQTIPPLAQNALCAANAHQKCPRGMFCLCQQLQFIPTSPAGYSYCWGQKRLFLVWAIHLQPARKCSLTLTSNPSSIRLFSFFFAAAIAKWKADKGLSVAGSDGGQPLLARIAPTLSALPS